MEAVAAKPTQPSADTAAQSATVLCVDDEQGILKALKRVFRRQGYRILMAESGAEGLEVVAREPVDLIISDMRMPQMSGAEFLQAGALEPEEVAAMVADAVEADRFLILPHPEVQDYLRRKVDDPDRWIRGMQRLQAKLASFGGES